MVRSPPADNNGFFKVPFFLNTKSTQYYKEPLWDVKPQKPINQLQSAICRMSRLLYLTLGDEQNTLIGIQETIETTSRRKGFSVWSVIIRIVATCYGSTSRFVL